MILTNRGVIAEASEASVALVGYSADELRGKLLEWLTARDSVPIPRHLAAIFHFTSFRGLWLFVHREGEAALVRQETSLRDDLSIEMAAESIPGTGS